TQKAFAVGVREKVRRGLVGINRRAIEVARDRKEALGLEEPAVRYLRQPTGTKPLCEKASRPLDSARVVERHISLAAACIVVPCQRRDAFQNGRFAGAVF